MEAGGSDKREQGNFNEVQFPCLTAVRLLSPRNPRRRRQRARQVAGAGALAASRRGEVTRGWVQTRRGSACAVVLRVGDKVRNEPVKVRQKTAAAKPSPRLCPRVRVNPTFNKTRPVKARRAARVSGQSHCCQLQVSVQLLCRPSRAPVHSTAPLWVSRTTDRVLSNARSDAPPPICHALLEARWRIN